MVASTTVAVTARPYLPNAHGVEHGEAAESIARSVGLAGTWWKHDGERFLPVVGLPWTFARCVTLGPGFYDERTLSVFLLD